MGRPNAVADKKSLNRTDNTPKPNQLSFLKSSSSPPPQNNPPAQNLQPNHNRHHHLPSLRSTRARLNNQRSPAPRVRDCGQIVALRDDGCAEAALLHDRRGGIVGSGRAAYVYSWGLRGRPGCCRGGRDVLRGRLVGVAAREGAFAVSLQGRAAADLLVVGELAEGVGGTAAGRELVYVGDDVR
jgi:hypothetical protein